MLQTKIVGGPLGEALAGDPLSEWLDQYPFIPFTNANKEKLLALVNKCSEAAAKSNAYASSPIVLAIGIVERDVVQTANAKHHVAIANAMGVHEYKAEERGLVGTLSQQGDKGVIVAYLAPGQDTRVLRGSGTGTTNNTSGPVKFWDAASGKPISSDNYGDFAPVSQALSEALTFKETDTP